MTSTEERPAEIREVDRIVVRFAGDSGDGMQLTGDRFASASALFGNDLATLPEFPAEIRAPAGTLAGVSAFQIQISNHDIHTQGDAPTVLVTMNPAAMKSDLPKLESGGTVIVNTDAFEERNLAKAGYSTNPVEDGSLDGYTVIPAPMTELTKEVCKDIGVKPRDAERSKNFFALGLVSWLYGRPTDPTLHWIREKFAGRDLVIAANEAAFKAGHAFGETAELGDAHVSVAPAHLVPGTYRTITGNLISCSIIETGTRHFFRSQWNQGIGTLKVVILQGRFIYLTDKLILLGTIGLRRIKVLGALRKGGIHDVQIIFCALIGIIPRPPVTGRKQYNQ